MGMNIAEKILAKAAGTARVVPGQIAVVEVGTCVPTDMNFLPASWRQVLKMRDPTRVVVVLDHLVPANEPLSAAAHTTAREFVKRFGITRFHDVGREQGISHVVVADNAYTPPGTVMVNPDSHTCGGGAFNCAARGVGLPETLFAVTTGKSWFRIGETIRYAVIAGYTRLDPERIKGMHLRDISVDNDIPAIRRLSGLMVDLGMLKQEIDPTSMVFDVKR